MTRKNKNIVSVPLKVNGEIIGTAEVDSNGRVKASINTFLVPQELRRVLSIIQDAGSLSIDAREIKP